MSIRPMPDGTWPQLSPDNFKSIFVGPVCLGNSTMYRMGLFRTQNGLFVGIEGRGAYEFHGYATPGYVSEKLCLRFEGDACAVADLINYVNGSRGTMKQFGEYAPDLCYKGPSAEDQKRDQAEYIGGG